MSGCAAFAIVTGVPGQEGKIPLVQGNDKPDDRWGLPGGSAEEDESHSDDVMMREVKEEIGIMVMPNPKLVLRTALPTHVMVFSHAEHYDGEPTPGEEVKCLRFFSQEEVEKMVRKGLVFYRHAQALAVYFGFKF